MKCPCCHKELPNGARFCLHCGVKLEIVNSTIECPYPLCHHQIPSDSKFCPDCGKPIKDTSDGGKSVSESGADTLEFTIDGVSFKMIRVEHGEFMMGATEEQEDPYDDEKPVHKVRLTDDYYMGETPVTQSLWRAVTNDNPSYFGEGGHGSYVIDWEELPVENVSWEDCQRFIRKLNMMTGKRFRLPTEAEWEFAARGGNDTCGYLYSGCDYLNDVAWYENNSDRQTHPIKQKKHNELGIYDMSGNVEEYCQDWYGDYKGSSQTNPTGPTIGSFHVIRGGSWWNRASSCRLSRRDYTNDAPDVVDNLLGLRLALSE